MFSKFVKVGLAAAALTVTAYAIPNDTRTIKLSTSLFDTTTGSSYTCTARTDSIYFLDGTVVVGRNCTLTVRPGAKIYGNLSTKEGTDATSILVIAPGGKLFAEGTVDSPIVFTYLRDDVKDVEDLGPGAKGLWGGILWCGTALSSSGTDFYPEGLYEGIPGVYYGGNDTNYYGGKMKYVSIRHGGCAVGSNSETNGLSLYGIGDSTEISYVEVFANSDDGVEFFGGNVGTDHMAMLFNSDDQFDLDDGYNGKNQFWFSVAQEYDGDHGGEFDGYHNESDAYCSAPTIFNYTLIGPGKYSSKVVNGFGLRDSLGGSLCNGIITEFAGYAIRRHTNENSMIAKELGAGLEFKGNIIWACGPNTDTVFATAGVVSPSTDVGYVSTYNKIADPTLRGISHTLNACLDPRPATGSKCYGYGVPEPAGLTNVNYVGAFDSTATGLWLNKWTAAYELRLLTSSQNVTKTTVSMNFHFCFKTSMNASQALQFHVQDPTAVPSLLYTDPRFKIYVDGVDKSAYFIANAGAPKINTATHLMYQIDMNPAYLLIPQLYPGIWAAPRVGPHTFRIVFPLSDGKVYEYTTRITLF